MSETKKYQIITFILLLISGGTFAVLSFVKIENLDWGFHLLIGKTLHEKFEFPVYETFSYWAEGQENKLISWAFSWLLYQVHLLAGFSGMVVLKAGISGLIAVITVLRIREALMDQGTRVKGDGLFLFMLTLLFTLLLFPELRSRTFARPEIFGYLFTALYLYFFSKFHRGGWNLKSSSFSILLLIQCVWVNFHTTFILGLLICAVYSMGTFLENALKQQNSEAKRNRSPQSNPFDSVQGYSTQGNKQIILIKFYCYSMPLVLLFLSTFINPYGFRIYAFVHELTQLPVHFISELQPTSLTRLSLSGSLLLFFSVLSAGYFAYQKQLTYAGLLMMFIIFGLRSHRFYAFFMVACVPLTALVFQRFLLYVTMCDLSHPKRIVIRGITWIAIGVPIITGLKHWLTISEFGTGLNENQYPRGAVEFIQKHALSGNMFNDFGLGAYLMWNLYPQYQVFIDGRTQVYGNEKLEQYYHFSIQPDQWKKTIEIYNIQFAVMPYPLLTSDRGFAYYQHLFPHSDWNVVYFDHTFVLCVKKGGANQNKGSSYHWIRPLEPETFHILEAIQEGHTEELIAELQRNLRESPTNYRSEFLLAFVYLNQPPEQQDLPKAIVHLTRALELRPHNQTIRKLLDQLSSL